MKTKIKSKSEVFNSGLRGCRKYLTQIPLVMKEHMPLEFEDDEFQRGMKDLQQCAMRFA